MAWASESSCVEAAALSCELAALFWVILSSWLMAVLIWLMPWLCCWEAVATSASISLTLRAWRRISLRASGDAGAEFGAFGGAFEGAFDALGGFAGGLGGALGEAADLVGNDGEAHAGFAGAGGFDGGVQGEDVGLESDFVDGLDDLGRVAAGGGDFADGGLEFRHVAGALFCGIAGLAREHGDLPALLAFDSVMEVSSWSEALLSSREAAWVLAPSESWWLASAMRREGETDAARLVEQLAGEPVQGAATW
ncbi:MAG: hypothetical protein U1F98_12940 [Verrucomicrobiota bacterium]